MAGSGDAEAQFSYALMLDLGDRVAMDKPTTTLWFRKAAEQNVPAACLYLGMKYEFGNTIEQDTSKAIHWYRKAALQGWAAAQFHFGSLYLTGSNMTVNPIKAYAWLSLAEENGYPGADEEKKNAVSLLSEEDVKKAGSLRKELHQSIE
jgi:hypothetical protein